MLQVNLDGFENVDAGFFSGDCLYTDFELVKKYVDRWGRAIKEHEGVLAEQDKENMTEDGKKMQTWMDGLEDAATVTSFVAETDGTVGFIISWSLKGFGFGRVSMYLNKEKNKWNADTECMGEETVEKILVLSAPAMAKMLVQLDMDGRLEVDSI